MFNTIYWILIKYIIVKQLITVDSAISYTCNQNEYVNLTLLLQHITIKNLFTSLSEKCLVVNFEVCTGLALQFSTHTKYAKYNKLPYHIPRSLQLLHRFSCGFM